MHYVYAVAPAPIALADAPPGIDDVALQTVEASGLAAVCSSLDPLTYQLATIEQLAGSLEWVGPRAKAHDAVVTWLSDRSPVVPFPMWAIFSDAAAVSEMLSHRAAMLISAIDRIRGAREYSLRVFARRDELTHHIATYDPQLAELERSMVDASPGQRYLLQRKLDGVRVDALRYVARSVASEVFGVLSPGASESVRSPVTAGVDGAMGSAILNAAFLVRDDALLVFRERLTSLVDRFGDRGFAFEFTGPWAPSHFVGDTGSE